MIPTVSQPSICMVQARYGVFFIPDEDDLIANSIREYGEWAQQEINILGAFIGPGDNVVDAGAYIGTHARAFSALVGGVGQVYAFEPDPTTFTILQQNAGVAAQSNIQLFNIGLGGIKAEVSLQIVEASHNRASASVIPAADAQSILITVQPLDELALPKVDFMKVDVEGMELQLLQGAEHTIRRHSPIIFLEVNSLHGSQGFLEWAAKHDYFAYGVNVAAFNEQNYLQSSTNTFGQAREVGMLLVPASKNLLFEATLLSLNLPRIDNLDDLVLLLLHKPQYIEDILSSSNTCKCLGLDLPTKEKQKNIELMALQDAKDAALVNASQAYAALRQAYDEKEDALAKLYEQLKCQQEQPALDDAQDMALATASQAYAALNRAYEQKEDALAQLHEKLKIQQEQLSLCEAKDTALANASQAYADLKHAYDQKEDALANLYKMLKAQQEQK